MSFLKLARKVACLLLVLGLFGSASPARDAAAQEPASAPLREATSLRFVPADASFYYSRLRMKQQYDAFVKSSAWTKLMELPAIKFVRELDTDALPGLEEEGVPKVREALDTPENQELIALLGELVTYEAFIYGDVGFAETYELLQKFTRLANEEILKEDNKLSDELVKLLEQWKVPDVVIGFKVTDTKRAETQLARLEGLLKEQLDAVPELKERFSREKIGAVEYLTWKLDGKLIPWDDFGEEAEDEEAKKNAAKFREKLEKKSLTINMGVQDGYLILSIGDTDEHLRNLGKGPLLADRPELAPLRKLADKPFISIGFASERFLKSASDVGGQIDSYVAIVEKMLPEAGLEVDEQKEMMNDIRGLAADIKTIFPEPGNYLGFEFLSPRGTEGYAYDWAKQGSKDGSQRLSILDHVGGKPLAFLAGRSKYAPEWHEMRAKWFGRALYWGERFGLQELPPEQVKIYEKLRVDLLPLVVRLDVAIKAMWLPAFKDGQNAWVVDGKLTSTKWSEFLPPATKPLPFLEFGIVSGVSDAPLLTQAAGELFDIAQKTADVLNTHFPDEFPKTEIPFPKSREFPEGTIHFYSPPTEAGVDAQIAPNAGLSKDTLALSFVPKFSLRLLKETPLEVKEGPLARAGQPLAAATYVDFAGFVDVLSAWIDYGFEQSGATGLEIDAETLKTSQEQVRTGLEFLKCLRSYSSVSYFEGGALVTHSEWNFVDLK